VKNCDKSENNNEKLFKALKIANITRKTLEDEQAATASASLSSKE
jgi:hypothetical protein